jgi:hypothetical protein
MLGGAAAPPLPPTFIDIAGGDLSPIFAYGNTNSVPSATRTIDRSLFGTPAAGDILIAVSVAPGYLGQSTPGLTEGLPAFQAWSNVIGSVFHTFADTSELSGGLFVREASGTTDDTCRINSPGPYPSFTQVCRLSGNPFTFPGTITAANDNSEIVNDPSGAVCERDLFGGWNECIEFFVSWKRANQAEGIAGEITMPAGILQLGTVSIDLDNGFDQSMIAAWGYHYSADFADRFNGSDASQAADNVATSASVGARYKTSIS